MKGIRHYRSLAGFHCIRVHYTADPDKDPATPKGAIWFKNAPQGYKGGINSAEWQREYEINWDTTGGELVFSELTEFQAQIFIKPFTIPEDWNLFASFDYGHRNPNSFHVYALDFEGNIYSVWEYYRAGVGYRTTAQEIRKCPYYNRLQLFPIADPSLWNKNQEVLNSDHNELKSVVQLFWELPKDEQVFFMPGQRGGDITVAEKIKGSLWNYKDLSAGKKPKLFIFRCCPMQYWELQKIRYKDWSAVMQEHRNLQEEIVDKDNHSFDDLKMFLNMFFEGPTKMAQEKYQELQKKDPAAYAEWMSVARLHGEIGSAKSSMGEFND